DLSGLLDLEGYYIDQRPPGLIFGSDTGFVNPRLTLFLDTRVGRHLYGFVEARFDRGFDPRSRFAAAHLDAYLARWTPLDTPLLNLQFGKFATMIGTWAQRPARGRTCARRRRGRSLRIRTSATSARPSSARTRATRGTTSSSGASSSRAASTSPSRTSRACGRAWRRPTRRPTTSRGVT